MLCSARRERIFDSPEPTESSTRGADDCSAGRSVSAGADSFRDQHRGVISIGGSLQAVCAPPARFDTFPVHVSCSLISRHFICGSENVEAMSVVMTESSRDLELQLTILALFYSAVHAGDRFSLKPRYFSSVAVTATYIFLYRLRQSRGRRTCRFDASNILPLTPRLRPNTSCCLPRAHVSRFGTEDLSRPHVREYSCADSLTRPRWPNREHTD
jgi:hypothetical protein